MKKSSKAGHWSMKTGFFKPIFSLKMTGFPAYQTVFLKKPGKMRK